MSFLGTNVNYPLSLCVGVRTPMILQGDSAQAQVLPMGYRAAKQSLPVHTTIPWTCSVAVIIHLVRRKPRSIGAKGASFINDKFAHRGKVNRKYILDEVARTRDSHYSPPKSSGVPRTFVPDCSRPLQRVPCACGIDFLRTKKLLQGVWPPRV